MEGEKLMNIITNLLTGAATVVQNFATILVNAVSSITSVFWSGEELTIVGAGLAMAIGVGAVYLIFRLVRGLVKQNNRG